MKTLGVVVIVLLLCVVVVATMKTCIPSPYPDTPSVIPFVRCENLLEYAKAFPHTPFMAKFRCPSYKSVADIHKKLSWGDASYPKRKNTIERLEKMSIGDLIEKQYRSMKLYDENMDSSTMLLYLDKTNMKEVLGEDTDFFTKIGDFDTFFESRMWCNTKDFGTRIHTDVPNNIVMQLFGNKRWVLASNRYTKKLHPTHKGRASQFYKEKEKKDLPNDVKTLIVDMGPGDMLYVPKGYIHFVYTLSASAMIANVFT